MNSAMRTSNIRRFFLNQSLKTGTASKHSWSTVCANADNMFPFQVVFVEKLVHEIENSFSSCSCGEETAKQKLILQMPLVYVAYINT